MISGTSNAVVAHVRSTVKISAKAKANHRVSVTVSGGPSKSGTVVLWQRLKTGNTAAEWNIFHDPLAAGIVFRSGVKIRMIPLDATNKVPIDLAFLRDVSRIRTPMAQLVAQILETERSLIGPGKNGSAMV